ncbi:tape measure protein [Sphingomonas sp. Root50]|uniref:tape measure protein n=2 Tax=Sphingomonas TaxID=13687 RepID=UPI00138F23F2|nr:tape measure protein [Sphingomonas sp. Root50]
MSRSVKVMAGALAGISAIAAARAFLEIADEAKNLDAQLKLATQSSGSFAQATDDVRRIADDTRSGLEETSRLYGNFQRNARQLGITQDQVARATETVSKTFKISGASTAEASGATRQLVQALQSGVLRGDEFNSVMEAAPRLSRLLADSLGVPVGQLRKMAEAGELTAQTLTKAFTDTRFTAQIDSEFKQLPVTFDQAMTRVRNAAVITFGAFDRGGEFSTALANFVGDGADGFADLERKAEDFGISVRGTIEGLADAFEPMFDTASSLFEALGIKFSDIFSDGRAQIRDLLLTIDQASGWLAKQGALGAAVTGNFDNYLNDKPRTGTDLLGRFNSRVASADMERQFNRQIRILEGAQNRGDGGGGGGSTSPTGKPKKAKKSPLDPDAFAREEAALNDQILRLKGDEVVDAEARAQIERDRIEQARAATVADVQGEKRYTGAQKAIIIALVDQAAALEQAKVIRDRDIQLAKEAVDARVATLKNDQDLLKAQGDIAGTREERHAIERRLLDLAFEEERASLAAITAKNGYTKADEQRARDRLAMLDRIQTAEQQGIDQRYESPLQRYRRDLSNPDRANDAVEEAVIGELESVRDTISSAAQKALGIKNPILAAIINSFIEQQLIAPLLNAFMGAAGGGVGGSIIGAIGGIFGFASGGSMMLGGRGGTDRNTLSLNGRPIANVSRGESLNIGSKTLGRPGGGSTVVQQITIDARNSVTPEGFARDILELSGQQAVQASGQMGQAVIKGVPSRILQYQRDGV